MRIAGLAYNGYSLAHPGPGQAYYARRAQQESRWAKRETTRKKICALIAAAADAEQDGDSRSVSALLAEAIELEASL